MFLYFFDLFTNLPKFLSELPLVLGGILQPTPPPPRRPPRAAPDQYPRSVVYDENTHQWIYGSRQLVCQSTAAPRTDNFGGFEDTRREQDYDEYSGTPFL